MARRRSSTDYDRENTAPDKDDYENQGQRSTTSTFISGLRSMETTHKPITMLRTKVVIVGDAAVGKTALSQMFHSNGTNYPKNYVMTVGVDFGAKQVKIPGTNTSVELYLYDCAGQSIFNQLNCNAKHWEHASYVMLVYDVSSRESFQSCGRWLQGVRAQRSTTGAALPGVVVANKVDLREQERGIVPSEEGEELAKVNGLKYFEVSSATNVDVNAPFEYLANHFHQKYGDTIQQTLQSTGRNA